MIRNVITSALVLSLALGVSACDKPVEGTTNPPDGGDATADAGDAGDKGKKDKKDKKDKGDKGDKGEEGGGEEKDPTQTVCPAETADYPAPYFADTVLIRLPKGVTEDNFYEDGPTFARLGSSVESVSCVEGLPGAMISWMGMTYFEDDTSKDVKTIRDETLEQMGFTGFTVVEEKIDDKMRYSQATIDVPPGAKPEPARALVQARAANGMMYVVVFETHPNAWNALKETFKASADKMSLLPPAG